MAGKTISSTVTKPITIGTGGYNSPLTITTTGKIAPAYNYYEATGITVPSSTTAVTITNHGGVYGTGGDGTTGTGYTGGYGIEIDSTTSLTNTGVIAAGYGGPGGMIGGNGGIGVDVQATSSINNSGQIFGAAGGYGNTYAGHGGDGVQLRTAATVNNSGLIQGGNGSNSDSYNLYAYRTITGGIGLSAGYEAVVTNTGHITGGGAGTSGPSTYSNVVGFSGAAGAALGQGSTLTNSGTITGGIGGTTNTASTETGGNGGDGVDLNAATSSNTGLINGGAGQYGSSDGGFGGAGVLADNYSVFTNKGSVVGGAGGGSNIRYGGGGGSGLNVTTYATATNNGHITGGAGGTGGTGAYFGDGGLQGGAGAYVYSGRLINNATITGGIGAATPGDANNNTKHHDDGGYGGTGIQLGGYGSAPGFSALTAINYGLVHGGAGGNIISNEGTAGNGGYGALIFAGEFTNKATIIGGAGGNVGAGASTYIVAGVGGAGAFIEKDGSLVNTGTIQGGTGGTNAVSGTTGGAGVFMLGGTFTDSGVVRGGTGGVSPGGAGARGDAIYLSGSIGGTIILNPSATFTGNIVATQPEYSDPPVRDVLEVAGISSTALTGFGTSITGFNVISFATGANRTIEGSFSSNNAIIGFAPHDTIVIDGFAAIPADTKLDSPYLELVNASSSTLLDLSLTQAKDIVITASGGKTTLAPASATFAHTLATNTAQLVFAGGTATSTLIKAGGAEIVEQNGTTSHTTIGGGALTLDVGAKITNGITFSTVTGGRLVIDSTTMPSATISGFIAGDTIKLAGVVYNASDRVTVGTAGTVTIATPGISYKLDIAGATVGETDFKFSAGSVLTKTTAQQALTFISAPELSTSGTSIAPHLAGAEIFLAYAQHQTALASLSLGPNRLEPTQATAGILAFHPEPHALLLAHIT